MTGDSIWTAIGLMSGTSMDGVDVAMITTDGHGLVLTGGGAARTRSAAGAEIRAGFEKPRVLSRPYSAGERAVLRRAVDEAKPLRDRDARPRALAEAEAVVTAAHAEAVEALLAEHGLTASDIDVVGFHGQTVLHRPEERLTVQIGDGAALAERLGIDVVHDFRAADVAAGGQGAPLAPAYHRALVMSQRMDLPVVVLNLGGVANVTWIGRDEDPIAFDTGPANALIDDWIREHTGADHDEGGAIAARGHVQADVLADLLDNPYFSAPAPKSLDRNAFDPAPLAGLSIEDGAATLVAFTAATVAMAELHFPAPARRWIVAGGGAKNPTIMEELQKRLDAPVMTAERVGWSGEYLEAQAFAYLAVRSLTGLPLSFPTTTGVKQPMTGGVLASARRSAA
ncbi:anhydro-N-acetylmuramic acid kinase [Lutibaculum baratangense]|uniref:Anhydro-N-acetylmuramic acid kinase n=1 Tax=Lutibaculum baratangense AMV1 TaxID=631454 RepID=V4TG32_9HYPH|nr:anhydro-N-acetylmuramic acid kinase [Lutibaculum baratangense]ESR25088.1 Anhydro-N-acetylmuramic acid kinase [Lutibaculum baratangense AMV1]